MPIVEESIADTDLRVIGLELAVRTHQHNEEELAMVQLQLTIRNTGVLRNYPQGDQKLACFRVTLHTNQGDMSAYLTTTGGVAATPNQAGF